MVIFCSEGMFANPLLMIEISGAQSFRVAMAWL
jgi:hypothetical protein